MAPEYQKAAKALKGTVGFGAIDCDQEANKPLCGQFGIQGFPTIKVKKQIVVVLVFTVYKSFE